MPLTPLPAPRGPSRPPLLTAEGARGGEALCGGQGVEGPPGRFRTRNRCPERRTTPEPPNSAVGAKSGASPGGRGCWRCGHVQATSAGAGVMALARADFGRAKGPAGRLPGLGGRAVVRRHFKIEAPAEFGPELAQVGGGVGWGEFLCRITASVNGACVAARADVWAGGRGRSGVRRAAWAGGALLCLAR